MRAYNDWTENVVPGICEETACKRVSIGSSPQRMPESNSNGSTHSYNFDSVLAEKDKTFLDDLKKLMEDGQGEEALDAAMSNMSAHLLQKLADRVNCDESGDRATLHLQFTH